MPAQTHTKAADALEAAAKSHRTASEQHTQGNHKAGAMTADAAHKLGETAHNHAKGAVDKSKAAAH